MQAAAQTDDRTTQNTSSERLCVSCRTSRSPSDLLRIGCVGGIACPQPKGTGRGAWVCTKRDCLDDLSPRSLGRSLKQPVAPFDSAEMIEAIHTLAEKRLLETIGLARRQGDLKTGVDRVSRSSGVVVVADDLSERSLRNVGSGAQPFMDGAALGRAAGMGWVGAIGFRPGSLADRAAYWLALWFETKSR